MRRLAASALLAFSNDEIILGTCHFSVQHPCHSFELRCENLWYFFRTSVFNWIDLSWTISFQVSGPMPNFSLRCAHDHVKKSNHKVIIIILLITFISLTDNLPQNRRGENRRGENRCLLTISTSAQPEMPSATDKKFTNCEIPWALHHTNLQQHTTTSDDKPWWLSFSTFF